MSEFIGSEKTKEALEDFINEFGMVKKILSGELDEHIKITQYPVGDKRIISVIDFYEESIGSVFEDEDSLIITAYYSGRNYGESASITC